MESSQFNRDDLAKFIKDPRTIRAFENLGTNNDELITNVNNILGSPILLFGSSATFSNDRVLQGSSDIALSDGGANLTISLTATGVSASTYGSAMQIPAFAVDAKGRITVAGQFLLTSTNVAEGTKLFFTDARARQAISGGDGIDYDDTTGIVSASPAGTYGTPTGTVSRATFATYTAPTISNPPTQSEVQAVANAVQTVSRTLAALLIDLQANGNLA